MKKAVKQVAVFEKKRAKMLINGKDAVPVLDIDQFKRHFSGAFHGVFCAAGRAETAVASERDKLKFTAIRTAIHGTAKSRVTTVDHLIDIFHLSISGMKNIFNFFIMVGKDFL